jgi:glutathione S-transferase
MAIVQSGVTVQLHEVSLRAKPAEMLALSPKGTVPVLHCADGQVLDESLAIVRWALAQSDPADWLACATSETSEHLLALNDGPFKKWLDRYKYFERYPEHPQTYYRDQGVECLISRLEAVLSDYAYLHGDRAGLTDIAIFPFVRQFAAVDQAWFAESPWQQTRRWLDDWLGSELFMKVMKKNP